MFFRLVTRLPAYAGVLAARVAAEDRPSSGRNGSSGYERSSRQANRASAADSAPPLTGGAVAALNAQLGSGWFSHRVVGASG